jgi:SSS family solute:Na+ symporter
LKLTLLDWMMMLIPLIGVIAIGLYARRYMRSVADFMTGGRVAGRYLVAVSDGMAAMGLITVVGQFEFVYKSGFAVGHWFNLAVPIWLFINLTGYIVYRFRETRAMTMAQFFEIRYSKRFRIFTGVLAYISGIVNYGIFPAVAARFFIHYCGLPSEFDVVGVIIPTYAGLMALFLGVALVIVLAGGHLTSMVTDCVQALFGYVIYLVIAAAILVLFRWDQMSAALLDRLPGESLLNPFDTGKLQDFNLGYVIISIIGSVYAYMAWQGNQGFNSAAASPHEAKMGRILGTWRAGALYVVLALIAAAAYTYMHHPDFSVGAALVNDELALISDATIRNQVTVPVAVSHFLPVGLVGAFAAVMLFLMISTDTTYLHSWGSILIQDVVLPLRKNPLTPEQHIRWLRLSIAGVAVFAFFFSLLFRQNDYIFMFFSITGAIYLGGAGSVIVGGLYWKRGTTAGAWASMITGAVLGGGGLILQQVWPTLAARFLEVWPSSSFLINHQDKFFINGQWMWFYAFVSAIAAYVVVSLLTGKESFNMDRMLHRGAYARPDLEKPVTVLQERKRKGLIHSYLGIDDDFTPGDRWLSYLVFIWTMVLFGIWLTVTLLNLFPAWRWSNEAWAEYFWIMAILFPLVVGVITSVWFSWGGIRDLLLLFRRLSVAQRNELDDGRVIDHRNADEASGLAAVEKRDRPK